MGAGRSGSAAQCVRGSLGFWGQESEVGRDFILLVKVHVYHTFKKLTCHPCCHKMLHILYIYILENGG